MIGKPLGADRLTGNFSVAPVPVPSSTVALPIAIDGGASSSTIVAMPVPLPSPPSWRPKVSSGSSIASSVMGTLTSASGWSIVSRTWPLVGV